MRDGGPAQAAGLKPNDVIQSFDGVAISTKTELIVSLAKRKPGAVITLGGLRGDARLEVKIKLGQR